MTYGSRNKTETAFDKHPCKKRVGFSLAAIFLDHNRRDIIAIVVEETKTLSTLSAMFLPENYFAISCSAPICVPDPAGGHNKERLEILD